MISVFFATTATAQVQLPEITVTEKTTSTVVNQKVNVAFETAFKGATEMRWVEVNKRYIVNFILNDQRNHALYSKNGKLLYHIIYGSEKHLPAPIKTQVMKQYTDYSITQAINIKQSQRDMWVVNLENKNDFILVKVLEGEMEQMKMLKKANEALVRQ
ncbi:hypothetical protein D3C80_718460 [compost metagenome]